jgi:Ser-tRNA(Ala) deacylase AlaX
MIIILLNTIKIKTNIEMENTNEHYSKDRSDFIEAVKAECKDNGHRIQAKLKSSNQQQEEEKEEEEEEEEKGEGAVVGSKRLVEIDDTDNAAPGKRKKLIL